MLHPRKILLAFMLLLASLPSCSSRPVHPSLAKTASAPLRSTVLNWRIVPLALQNGYGDLYDAQGEFIDRGPIDELQQLRMQQLRAIHGNGRINLPAPTMGGKQFWKDLLVQQDWRIQHNVITDSYRLLDPQNIRRAWGSFAGCQVAFEQRRLALGLRPQSSHAVVLLHGIVRSRASLDWMQKALHQAGYEVIGIDYASTQEVQQQSMLQVASVLADQPGIERVSFVTHSMGGIILRRLLSHAAAEKEQGRAGWWDQVEAHRAVMLFPPNQGAHLANVRKDWLAYNWIMGPAGQELTTEVVSELPDIALIPTAIFAGGRGHDLGRSSKIPGDDDGTVAVQETYLEGAEVWRRFNVGHTFGMNDPDLIQAAVHFINNGKLSDEFGEDLLDSPEFASP